MKDNKMMANQFLLIFFNAVIVIGVLIGCAGHKTNDKDVPDIPYTESEWLRNLNPEWKRDVSVFGGYALQNISDNRRLTIDRPSYPISGASLSLLAICTKPDYILLSPDKPQHRVFPEDTIAQIIIAIKPDKEDIKILMHYQRQGYAFWVTEVTWLEFYIDTPANIQDKATS
jgi:hypothetical protein